ncbi:MAG TPA: molybdopterin molybdotransferase MoeA [Woeseiaceae bacterium]
MSKADARMLGTKEAAAAIAATMPVFGTKRVGVQVATGRVLRETVRAERDQPPFDRVTMDGIAISFDAIEDGLRSFPVQATLHAGDPAVALADNTHCIEVMTGAVLPRGSDCVVPVERVRIRDTIAELAPGYQPDRRQFIHARGSDHAKDAEVLFSGSVISPMDIAIIASCGLPEITVSEQPVIRVLSTGSELLPAGEPIEPHQVRLSNGPALVAMLQGQQFDDCLHEHLVDEPAILQQRIAAHLDAAGVLILSGGVSMGKKDFVPQVLLDLGVKLVFHKIGQRPGKPMWYGTGPDGQAVFALPGNPVSTLVCCRHYVLPALLAASGRTFRGMEWAVLTEDVTVSAELTVFLPVRLTSDVDGIVRAQPVATNTSGDFTSLGGTDGYVELVREQAFFPRGSPVPLHRWAAP